MASDDTTVVPVHPVFTVWAGSDPAENTLRIPTATVWQNLARERSMAEAVMVVDLRFGGSTGQVRVRVATMPLRSVATDGTDHSALGALMDEPPLSADLRLGEATSSARSLTLTLDASALRPMRLIRSGLYLSGVAEVALEMLDPDRPGSTLGYDQRLVVMRGLIDGVRFGAVQLDVLNGTESASSPNRIGRGVEIAELEVVDPREVVQTRLPPWIVDSDGRRWATPHPSAIGQRYPWLVNGYTNIPAVRVTAVAVGGNDFVFAYGTNWNVTSVRVNGVVYASGDLVYGWTQIQGTDGIGTPYSAIRFTVGATVWADSGAVHVTVQQAAAVGVLEVIRQTLAVASPLGELGLNPRMFGESAARFDAIVGAPQILANSGRGASEAAALDWIEGGLLASYPMVSMAWEDGAYGPVVADWRLPPVAEFIVGTVPLLDRASLVQASPVAEVWNEFLLRYDYDPLEDTYGAVASRNAQNSDLCAASQSLVGRRDAPVIESPYITDSGTANAVLDWLVTHRAQPSYLVEYEALGSAWLTVRRGDPVRLTDDDFGWVRERALVENTEYRTGRVVLRLRVFIHLVDVGGAALSVAL
ncbi:MAG: hypothetical protein KGS10_05470 [Chloroflexi bacterium]|nr:hypothetical protein [Chloroflexota bacterium]